MSSQPKEPLAQAFAQNHMHRKRESQICKRIWPAQLAKPALRRTVVGALNLSVARLGILSQILAVIRKLASPTIQTLLHVQAAKASRSRRSWQPPPRAEPAALWTASTAPSQMENELQDFDFQSRQRKTNENCSLRLAAWTCLTHIGYDQTHASCFRPMLHGLSRLVPSPLPFQLIQGGLLGLQLAQGLELVLLCARRCSRERARCTFCAQACDYGRFLKESNMFLLPKRLCRLACLRHIDTTCQLGELWALGANK